MQPESKEEGKEQALNACGKTRPERPATAQGMQSNGVQNNSTSNNRMQNNSTSNNIMSNSMNTQNSTQVQDNTQGGMDPMPKDIISVLKQTGHIILAIIILLTLGAFIFKAGMTGRVVGGEGYLTYIQTINESIAESQEMTWAMDEHPEEFNLKSVRLDGHLRGEGGAKAYLIGNNGLRYLILDQKVLHTEGLTSITGNALEVPQEGEEEAAPNTKGVTTLLEYQQGSSWDIDNDGVAYTEDGVVDLTVENTLFNWPVDESRLCTKWTVSPFGSAGSTIVCNGAADCCAVVGVAPEEESWKSPLYVFQGKYGTTENNRITAQAIYIDQSIGEETHFESAVGNEVSLQVKFIDKPVLTFSGVCVDTCLLPDGLDATEYQLVFELDRGVELFIEKFTYTLKNLTAEEAGINETNLTGTNATVEFNPEIRDSRGNRLAAIIEIIDEDGAVIDRKEIKEDAQEAQGRGRGIGIAAMPEDNTLTIQGGTYDITVKLTDSADNPVKSISFDDVELESNISGFVMIDDVNETGEFEQFEEIYAIDPTAIEFANATVTVTAKGEELYKCKEWNFTEQRCEGTWAFVQALTPGQEYTLNLTPEDPAWGELPSSATIVINGDMSDWTTILTNPANTMTDGVSGIDDADTSIQSNRDLVKYAYTWNSTYLFSYFKKVSVGTVALAVLVYLDLDNDGYMESNEKVERATWSSGNTRTCTTYLNNYVPVNASGDALTGDGVDMPGSITNQTTLDSGLTCRSTQGIELEIRLNWTRINKTAGSPIGMHISSAQGTGTNLPTQVEDNVAKTGTGYASVEITPDNAGGGSNGTTVSYTHTVRNLGNNEDTINIDSSSSQGWTVGLYYVNGTALADTNSDGTADMGVFTANQSKTLIVNVTIPGGAAQGTVDETTITAVSSPNPDRTDSATDTTTAGTISIYPAYTVKTTNGTTLNYNHTIANSQGMADVININAASNNSWTTALYYANGTTLADTNSDGAADVGNLSSGETRNITVRLSVPAGTAAGTVDKTTVYANSSSNPSNYATKDNVATADRQVRIVNNESDNVGIGSYTFYTHTVTNNWNTSDTININYSSSRGWPVVLYMPDRVTLLTDTNSDGKTDVGSVSPNGGSVEIAVRVSVPTSATVNTVDNTTITISSASSPSATDLVIDSTRAKKLVFYNDSIRTLNDDDHQRNETVYTRTFALAANTNHFHRWIMPNGTIARTSASAPTNAQGQIDDSYTVPGSGLLGNWTVVVYRTSGTLEVAREYFNVYEDDAPEWSGNRTKPATPTNYSGGASYQFNVTWNDETGIDTVLMEHNFTGTLQNYSTTGNNSDEYYYNYTNLPGGTYVWRMHANDTDGYRNSTDQWTYIVSRAGTTTQLYINGTQNNITVTYGTATNATATTTTGSVTLYRNGTTVSNPEITTLNTGFYNYTATNPGNQNYTASTATWYVTVNKATTTCSLLFDKTTPQTYNTTLNASCTCNNPETTATLWRNNTDVTATENNIQTTLPAGTWDYACNTTATQNYTAASDTSSYTINKTIPTLTLTATPSWTETYGTTTTINCTTNTAQATPQLYRNGTLVSIPDTQTLAANSYNYECNSTATQNYTTATTTNTLTINKASTTTTLYLNGTQNNRTITYGAAINATAMTSAGTVALYRNGTSVTNPHITILAASYHNYTATNPGNANYTGSTATLFATVNKASSACSLRFDKATPQTYGTTLNASCTCTSPEAPARLYRNNIDVTTTENDRQTMLPAGTWVYRCNVTATQNYTSATNTSTFTINKAASDVSLLLDGTDGNITIERASTANITAARTAGEGNIEIYRNGTLIASGAAELTDVSSYNSEGLYNITARYPATQNYTASQKTHWLSVDDTIPPGPITSLMVLNKNSIYIYWVWNNPLDTDYGYTEIWLNNTNMRNTSNEYYLATGLNHSTTYTLSLRTVDEWGTLSSVWVNDTRTTDPNCTQNWVEVPTQCWLNDTRLKLYNDTNSCGLYSELPADNNALVSCDCVLSTRFNGSTTNFTRNNLTNLQEAMLELWPLGTVRFLENITIERCIDIDSNASIGRHYASISSTQLPELNKSANITLYNLSFVLPRIMMGGGVCPSSICTQINYSEGIMTFNVTHFTNYSVEEGPYCGDGACNGNDTCSNCALDCGGCGGGGPGGGGGGGTPREECTPNWLCYAWSACEKNSQHRKCFDANACSSNDTSMPAIERACVAGCSERWACSEWGECTEAGVQTKTCNDLAKCGTENRKPQTVQPCEYDHCGDGRMNDEETGVDCGGECNPCAEGTEEEVKGGRNVLTGEAIAVRPYEPPNLAYALPLLLLLVLLIAIIALQKTRLSDTMKRLLTAVHILLIISIVTLLLLTFDAPKITGEAIADITSEASKTDMFVGTIIAATLLGILTYLAINAFTKKGGREAEPPQPPPEDNKKEKTKEGTYKGRI